MRARPPGGMLPGGMDSSGRQPDEAQTDLAERLRAGRELLARLAPHHGAAERAVARLDRDLLPRTAGGADGLVAGIVGPNNAGKSALFNGLVGRSLSPSRPEGGATRRLVGAATPALLERMRRDPTLARFTFSDLPCINIACTSSFTS